MAKLQVALVFGGRSVEHEVSVASATSILSALDPARYAVHLVAVDRAGRWRLGAPGELPEAAERGEEVRLRAVPGEKALVSADRGAPAARLDAVIPVIHGTGGEDGSLQGLLELAEIPYVGAGVLGSALAMDKEVSKRLLRAAGLPVVPGICVRADALGPGTDAAVRRAVSELGLPVFVKPASLGSSVGISKARTPEEVVSALQEAARYDLKILVERAVEGREIEVAVLGNEEPEASVPGEIVPRAEFYDYEAKYASEDTELRVPASLEPGQERELRRLALAAFRTLEGAGLARVDFFLERGSGLVRVNEVNTIPGFTEGSMFPRLWEASGLAYPALLDRLVELALERDRRRSTLERTYRRG